MSRTSKPKPPAGPRRRVLARVLTVIGVVIALAAILAGFIRLELFDTGQYRTTSELLIENTAIQESVAATLVDRLYTNVDVKQELQSELPENLQALAGPLSLGVRQLANRAAAELLGRPAVQGLWVAATTRAQERLVSVLEGGGDFVSTEGGTVSVDLRELLVRLSEELGIGQRATERIPQDAGQVAVVDSEQLGLIQDVVKVLKKVALFLWVLPLLLWGVAIWLMRGYRRVEIRAIAGGLLIIGFGILLLLKLIGNYLVDEIVQNEANSAAADAVWSISTRLLRDAGWTVVIIGAFAFLGAWFTGPDNRAQRARAWATPYLRRPEIAYGSYAILIFLLIWWGPTAQWRNWLPATVMVAVGAIGLEAIRRTTLSEVHGAGEPPASLPRPPKQAGS
jgi:hypothetical protein